MMFGSLGMLRQLQQFHLFATTLAVAGAGAGLLYGARMKQQDRLCASFIAMTGSPAASGTGRHPGGGRAARRLW